MFIRVQSTQSLKFGARSEGYKTWMICVWFGLFQFFSLSLESVSVCIVSVFQYFWLHAQWIRLLGLRCSWHLQGATIPIGANVSVTLVILPSVIKIALLHLHIRSPIIINFAIPLGHGFIDGSNLLPVFPHEVLADFPSYDLQSFVTFILKIILVGHRMGLISL